MNWLAHSRLSFSDGQVVGNLIEDYLTAAERSFLPEEVIIGTHLHRKIDVYTDTHPCVKKAAKILFPVCGRYSVVFTDLVWDYFLACSLSEQELRQHSDRVYQVLESHYEVLPQKFLRVFPFMKSEDVLYQIKTETGLQKSISYMKKRAKFLPEVAPVFEMVMKEKLQFQHLFDEFYPQLEAYVFGQK